MKGKRLTLGLFATLVAPVLLAAMMAGCSTVAEKGPGTYFNPKDGNAVSAVTNVQASVRRTVAFLGGSITEMNGFRPRVMKALRAKYPDVAFTEFAAGLSSTCSDTAAFRLRRDVLSQCVPDLLIVDEAVNDDQDGHLGREHAVRGLEGIVRQALLANPRCRIVLALMVNEGQYAELLKGKVPLQYAVEKEVAGHYGLAVADVGSALADSARVGGMSWTEYKDCHPSPAGCDLGAKVVMDAISSVFDPRAEAVPQALPAPMDGFSYFNACEVPLGSVSGGVAWKVSELDWSAVPGDKRGYFTRGDVLWCETTNATASVTFEGTAIGFMLTAGPDAGDLEVSVDGGDFTPVRLRANYGRLHYPYTVMLADGLASGRHTVRFRVVAARRGERIGTTVRINRIYANGI